MFEMFTTGQSRPPSRGLESRTVYCVGWDVKPYSLTHPYGWLAGSSRGLRLLTAYGG